MVMPPIVLCAGLPRSGSTWIYNVVLQLCQLSGRSFANCFSDTVPKDFLELIKGNKTLVIKSHAPAPELVDLVRFVGGQIILSVRDPRDCVSSLIQAFNYEKSSAITLLKECASALDSILDDKIGHIVRYEDSIDRAETISAIATAVGCELPMEGVENIYTFLKKGAVNAVIQDSLESGLIDAANPAQSWTAVTFWHPNHIGDSRIGKHVDFLTPEDSAIIGRLMPNIMSRFGYIVYPIPAISDDGEATSGDYISLLCKNGMSYPENWGVWTDSDKASMELCFSRAVKSVCLEIRISLGPSFYTPNEKTCGAIFINEELTVMLDSRFPAESEIIVINKVDLAGGGNVSISFEFSNIKSPLELNIGEDVRRLGVAVKDIRWVVGNDTEVDDVL